MKNGMFVPATQCKSHPNVKSDGKARFDTGKPTLTQQGIDVDKFIHDNHAVIEKTQKGNTVKHEYTFEELAELKKIYDESGEAGLELDEMRALRKAGLLTQDLPAKPSKRDLILAHCKKRIDQGQPFDGKETAEALGMSQKTVGNILSQLRKEGLLPAFDRRSPRKTRKQTQPERKKETIMTVASKPVANKEEPMSQTTTASNETTAPEKQCENPRAIIVNALVGIYDSISALQRGRIPRQRQGRIHVRHQAAERRIDGHQGQLQQGRGEMRLKFNSKDGVFTVKAESEEEKTALKTSAPAICNLIIDFFNGEVQEMKAAKE